MTGSVSNSNERALTPSRSTDSALGITLVVMTILAVFLVVGCGVEQKQETVIGETGGTRVAPLSGDEAKRAKAALADMPPAGRGWVNAIALATNTKGEDWVRALVNGGVVVLEDGWGNSSIATLVAPGDAFRYSTKGDDLVVRDDEVRVIDIAVTEVTP